MNILHSFWYYWKWLCVALMTTFVILALIAAIINAFKSTGPTKEMIGQCIENGGSWDDTEHVCKDAA